eukprot:979620-Rhodomonas_salina.1
MGQHRISLRGCVGRRAEGVPSGGHGGNCPVERDLGLRSGFAACVFCVFVCLCHVRESLREQASDSVCRQPRDR